MLSTHAESLPGFPAAEPGFGPAAAGILAVRPYCEPSCGKSSGVQLDRLCRTYLDCVGRSRSAMSDRAFLLEAVTAGAICADAQPLSGGAPLALRANVVRGCRLYFKQTMERWVPLDSPTSQPPLYPRFVH